MMSLMTDDTTEFPALSVDAFGSLRGASSLSFPVWTARRPIYAFDWAPRSAHFCELAAASFVADASASNLVQTATLSTPQPGATFAETSTPQPLAFPSTRLMFSPHQREEQLFGVSGDGLRIYRQRPGASSASPGTTELVAKLVPAQISTSPSSSAAASRRPSDANIIISSNSGYSSPSAAAASLPLPAPKQSPAPITSFDWNRVDPTLLVTSSYDTTCAVWNLNTASVKTQLIAHDKEVFDVAFNPKSADIFASVGAEGSIRLFDTRALDHSTILYETLDAQPLLRLAWNPLDSNYVACFGVDGQQVVLVDTRSAAVPVAILSGHSAITSIAWAPHNSGWLSVADGCTLKLWDVSQNVSQAAWSYEHATPLQNTCWPVSAPDWFAFSTKNQVQLLKL
jgi:WD40 repeat protein